MRGRVEVVVVEWVGDGEGGAAEPSSSSDVGHVFGTAIPAVRKKRVGEAKESNALPGLLNSFSLNRNSV